MNFEDNPVIAQRRESARLLKVMIAQKAEATYATFSKDERTILQFGMLPHDKTLKAEAELIVELIKADGQSPDPVEIGRMFAVALMDCANRGSQKMVV